MNNETDKHFHPNQGPQDASFKALLRRPTVAWPTIIWFAVTLMGWVLSTVAGCAHWWPLWLSVVVNSLMVFSFFTVIHDSSHRAISANSKLNDLLGGISTWFFGPSVVFTLKAFRYLHMQHHLYTNEKAKDPDFWCAGNNRFLLVLSWLTVDLHYIVYYAKHWHERPTREAIGLISVTVIKIAIFGGLVYLGYGWQALFLWLIPGRVGISLLAFTLDYLPHTPHKILQTDNPYLATNLRMGNEWLLTPLMMCHNYHLMHHLFPLVPFYRYHKLWQQGEAFFLDKDPAILSPLGKRITVSEYKAKYMR